MPIFARIIAVFWLVFIAYWLVSAVTAKKRIRRPSWWLGRWFRLALVLVTFRLQHLPVFQKLSNHLHLGVASSNPAIGIVGVILCAAGIAFAIWARRHLGRNWGMPMSLQEGHELVTTGPYTRVRHPIYTGILLAMLGSALAVGAAWFLPFFIFGAYFIYSAKTEEKLMIQEFPNEYPAYQARTKVLVPFVW
jgi:protein-S-isoprenylcysteine O-methyltransferase Ste14